MFSSIEEKTGSMRLSNFLRVIRSESGRPDIYYYKTLKHNFITSTCPQPRRSVWLEVSEQVGQGLEIRLKSDGVGMAT